jgi:hypothetical protein
MKKFIFKATTLPAYFDEDTVYDSFDVEFDIEDIDKFDNDIFYISIIHGNTEYLQACYRETLEFVREIKVV